MSVPHLDTRVVDGEASLLFGPFATFSPKFLKNGRVTDIVAQVRPGNILPMLKVAIDNPGLIKYLVGELLKGHKQKVDSLRTFMPTATSEGRSALPAGRAPPSPAGRRTGAVAAGGGVWRSCNSRTRSSRSPNTPR